MKVKNLNNLFTLLSKVLCILILQGWSFNLANAQSGGAANAGKEFYISYLHNLNSSGGQLQLKVVVEQACYITARYNATSTYWNGWNNTLVTGYLYRRCKR